jgi:riboflavin biosynthesis pyrimidine reductase
VNRLDTVTALDDPLAPYRDAERPPPAGRPWLLANMVCGLDGSTAVDGRVGELSGPTDRQLFKDLRSVADVVLVGAETARRERYGPVRLSDERRDHREGEGRPPVPRLAIVSRSLDLDDAARALQPGDGGEPPIVVTCEASPADRREALAGSAEVVLAGTDRVEAPLALEALHAAGARVVLCEGGPSLLGDLLAAQVVDELCLTLSPVVGGDPLPVAVLPQTAEVSRATLAHVLEADGDLFLRYVFR